MRAALHLTLATASLLFAAPAFGQDEEGTCVSCHEVDIDEALARPVPEWRESVHAAHWVSCDACHGGDPRVEDADDSMSLEAGFLDLPSWAEMTEHCGMCHEAIAESYRGGRFGQALVRGRRVPTCATCHMRDGHRIVAAAPGQIDATQDCQGCPGVDDSEATRVLLERMDADEARLLAAIADVESKGIALSDLREQFDGVHRSFQLAVHLFDDVLTVGARDASLDRYAQIAERVAEFDREADSRRRLGLGLMAALALLFGSLWLLSRTLR